LRKVEAKSLEAAVTVYTLLKGLHFRIAKNWQYSGFVAKFQTKFALFEKR